MKSDKKDQLEKNWISIEKELKRSWNSVQGVESLGGHFEILCQGFDFYEVKKEYCYFSKRKGKYFYTFNHFYSEKSSKRSK